MSEPLNFTIPLRGGATIEGKITGGLEAEHALLQEDSDFADIGWTLKSALKIAHRHDCNECD